MTDETERDARTVLELFRARQAARLLEDQRRRMAQSRLGVDRHGDAR